MAREKQTAPPRGTPISPPKPGPAPIQAPIEPASLPADTASSAINPLTPQNALSTNPSTNRQTRNANGLTARQQEKAPEVEETPLAEAVQAMSMGRKRKPKRAAGADEGDISQGAPKGRKVTRAAKNATKATKGNDSAEVSSAPLLRHTRYRVKGPRMLAEENAKPHPVLQRHINMGTDTWFLHNYYALMPHNVNIPLAGIRHVRRFDDLFRHKVPEDDVEIEFFLTAMMKGHEFDKQWRKTGMKRANKTKQEETFQSKTEIKIPVPDHIKAILVDDWENVTKNSMLVPIPCPKPVNKILDDYIAIERPKRLVPNGQGKNGQSTKADLFDEVVAGVRQYFDQCLGRILLYKYERAQYLDVLAQMNSDEGEFAGKEIGDIYGAEHLCRLIASFPELIAETGMDRQSVSLLREELTKFCSWLGRNVQTYFTSAYEHPGQEYLEKHRRS